MSQKSIDPPTSPVKGMQFWVANRKACTYGTNHSITDVNSRSFYVASNGSKTRHLLQDWNQWIHARMSEGELRLDAQPVRRPPGLQPGWTLSVPTEDRAEAHKRLCSAQRIATQYTFVREMAGGKTWRFRVTGGSAPYTVVVDPGWGEVPRCTCPYASHGDSWWCKHALAVLLREDELRCQLLDILLPEAP